MSVFSIQLKGFKWAKKNIVFKTQFLNHFDLQLPEMIRTLIDTHDSDPLTKQSLSWWLRKGGHLLMYDWHGTIWWGTLKM